MSGIQTHRLLTEGLAFGGWKYQWYNWNLQSVCFFFKTLIKSLLNLSFRIWSPCMCVISKWQICFHFTFLYFPQWILLSSSETSSEKDAWRKMSRYKQSFFSPTVPSLFSTHMLRHMLFYTHLSNHLSLSSLLHPYCFMTSLKPLPSTQVILLLWAGCRRTPRTQPYGKMRHPRLPCVALFWLLTTD